MTLCEKAILAALSCCLCAFGAARADLSGRVVDLQRLPLAGVKVTLRPEGIVAVTQADGSFRLDEASPVRPAAPSLPAPFLIARTDLGFRMAPGMPAVDLRGRRSRPAASPWLFLASLSGSGSGSAAAAPRASVPLAKTSGGPDLTAEKPGFQTAFIPAAAGPVLPDIVLAPGLDLSRPLPMSGSNPYSVPLLPRVVGFSGSTSTELPNLHDPVDSAIRIDSVPFDLQWEFSTESGVPLFVRPSDYFPRFPEGLAATAPDGVSDDTGQASLGIQEVIRNRDGKWVLPGDLSPFVNLLLWKKTPGSAYGALRCLQFQGPIKSGWKSFEELHGQAPNRVLTRHEGSVPALDLGGKIMGRITWKGPGAMPELWVGMPGTDLFAPIAPDGAFLSTDLPPGRPPVVLVRVDRSEDGAAVPRAVQALAGLEVIPGQTAVLDGIILSGE